MKRIFVLVIALTVITPVFAQTKIDSQTQKTIEAVINQRNAALNAQAVAEGNVAYLNEELEKSKAKVKEFEEAKKPEAPKK